MTTTQGFICKYTGQPCPYIDTSGMTQEKTCGQCSESGNETRATGAMPGLEWIYKQIKKLIKR